MTNTDNTALLEAWLLNGRTLPDGTVMSDERLDAVFQLVNPANHGAPRWKYPIDVFVREADATVDEIIAAVSWFCGGRPDVTTSGPGMLRVVGAGYYEWVGA